MRSKRQPVATRGNGFRLFLRFLRPSDLRPVATGCNHGAPKRLHSSLSDKATTAPAEKEQPAPASSDRTFAHATIYALEMSDSENFTFNDVSDGDEVWVVIRAVEGGTGLALSKKADGDMEVFMPPDAVARLVAALGTAPLN
jgi:hypothetical protein